MISVFLREQRRYSRGELEKLFGCPEEKLTRILRRLKEYGIVKAVRASEEQRELTDLTDEDAEVAEVEADGGEYLYVFTFVGVVIAEGCVLKCCPKYLPDGAAPRAELKQVLKVLEKYNAREQIIRMYSDAEGGGAVNRLAVMLFLLQDYFTYGIYTNTQDVIEVNGPGEVLWDRTINETFMLLSGGRPFYPELLTAKRKNDELDYFKRLHECVLAECTREMEAADLLDLFDIEGVEFTAEPLEALGDRDSILERITKELGVQFNTRKQRLLKTLYAYVAGGRGLAGADGFSMFGSSSFHRVWEQVCAEIMGNDLQKPLKDLRLPGPLSGKYKRWSHKRLIDLIERPCWTGRGAGGTFVKEAKETLEPDMVSILDLDGTWAFFIFDAKYYDLQLEPDRKLRGQPGIGDVTKQYLYQLAYRSFVEDQGIETVRNCFLMPTAAAEVEKKGSVSLRMLRDLGLQDIQVRLIPAETAYRYYLQNKKLDVRTLDL